jgi:hypothetical protein
MNPAAKIPEADNPVSTAQFAILQFSAPPSEIRVRREVIESALQTFHEDTSEIRQREEMVFKTLRDLLPQIFVAMVEKELTIHGRSVIFHVLQQLSEPVSIHTLDVFARDARSPRQRRLSDASMALWLAEDLPHILERAKELLDDYFDELLQCVRDVEAARWKLFRTLDIPVAKEHRDLAWIRGVKLAGSSFPILAWQIPASVRCLLQVPYLRTFMLRKCENWASDRVSSYCDRLSAVARQIASDWLSEIQWQLDQDLSERTDSWAISAEIVKLLREHWGCAPPQLNRLQFIETR